MPETTVDPRAKLKQEAAEFAVQFVQSGMVVGLGTGSTAIFATRKVLEILHQRDLDKKISPLGGSALITV